MELGDSDKSEHKFIMSNTEAHLSKGFKCFVLDMHRVTRMNSTILSLVIGLSNSILREQCRMFLSGLNGIKRDMLLLSFGQAIQLKQTDEILIATTQLEELKYKQETIK